MRISKLSVASMIKLTPSINHSNSVGVTSTIWASIWTSELIRCNAFSQQRLSAFAVRHRLRYTIVVVANCSIPHNPDRQSLTFRYRPERGIQHPLSRGRLLRSLTRAFSLIFVVLLSRSV